MPHGVVKWFNTEQRFGFITENSGIDRAVLADDVQEGGPLKKGATVTFEVRKGHLGQQAVSVRCL